MIKITKNIAVFGTTFAIARYQLTQMLNNFRYGDVLKVTNNPNCCEVLLKDGTRYKAFVADESARGQRFDMVFVQHEISGDNFYNVIYHSMLLPDPEKIIYFQ